jgi:hypothetical protein
LAVTTWILTALCRQDMFERAVRNLADDIILCQRSEEIIRQGSHIALQETQEGIVVQETQEGIAVQETQEGIAVQEAGARESNGRARVGPRSSGWRRVLECLTVGDWILVILVVVLFVIGCCSSRRVDL